MLSFWLSSENFYYLHGLFRDEAAMQFTAQMSPVYLARASERETDLNGSSVRNICVLPTK